MASLIEHSPFNTSKMVFSPSVLRIPRPTVRLPWASASMYRTFLFFNANPAPIFKVQDVLPTPPF